MAWVLGSIAVSATIIVIVFTLFKESPIPTVDINNLKLVGERCEFNGSIGWCKKLLGQAISPEMYLRDARYRNKVKKLEVKYAHAQVIPFTALIKLFRRSVPLTKVRIKPSTTEAFERLSEKYKQRT